MYYLSLFACFYALFAAAAAVPAFSEESMVLPHQSRAASDGPALLSSSVKVISPPFNSTFRFDGHLFNFTYDGIGGSKFHTTAVQVQITTLGMGEGYRATGMPKTFNGYARTTEATIANIRPNAFQPNSSRLELDGKLFNRYEYQLMAPKIPEWQRDLPGYLVVIEFYSTPSDQDLLWTNVQYWPLKLTSSTPI